MHTFIHGIWVPNNNIVIMLFVDTYINKHGIIF